jgi:hypothetical protein
MLKNRSTLELRLTDESRRGTLRMSIKPRKTSKKEASRSSVQCVECSKEIAAKEQALFVEEEVGRYFCTEACIVAHMTPEIEKLEREYGKHVSANDLNSEERERYAHLRWMTLEQPDEVWMEKTAKGDHRYTLIAEFKPEKKQVWAVAICLMLRNEPSFLYLAFVTSDRYLADAFRKGDKMKVIRKNSLAEEAGKEQRAEEAEEIVQEQDRLAEPWTEADSLRASIIKSRKSTDIPAENFAFYQNCLEETLQEPTELWSYLPKAAKRVYHFVRKYEHDSPYWYVVIAKDTTDETQIEIVDAFPTQDEKVVQLCRHGRKEALNGKETEESATHAVGDNARRNVH